jgi:hypothetical protein
MNLKLKSLIYRYTGVYLADHELREYINSPECKQSVTRRLSHPDNDMSLDEANDLAIGLWDCRYGFTRPLSLLRFKEPQSLFKVIGWFDELYTVIKWDIQDLMEKLK